MRIAAVGPIRSDAGNGNALRGEMDDPALSGVPGPGVGDGKDGSGRL
ncbi:MAG: hypothetical protein O3A47_09750 [Chloroflexi bacterium]|nr:hypothetical protein [Chloroflexota bacterium]